MSKIEQPAGAGQLTDANGVPLLPAERVKVAEQNLVNMVKSNKISPEEAGSRMNRDISEGVRDEIKRTIKPAGYYKGLTPLVDARRLEFGMANCYFHKQPTFDHVFVYQITEDGEEEETIGPSGIIVKPQQRIASDRQRSCRGVLISAGLQAMEQLASHDVQLGDLVTYLHMSPWCMKVGEVLGQAQTVMVLRAGNIVANEGTAARLHDGRLYIDNLAKESNDLDLRYFSSEDKTKHSAPKRETCGVNDMME